MNYFEVRQDMSIRDQWYLSAPYDSLGKEVPGWAFSSGKKVGEVGGLSTNIYQSGTELLISFGSMGMLYVELNLCEVLGDIAKEWIQFFDVNVVNAKNKYKIVNPCLSLDVIHSSSDIENFSEKDISKDPLLAGRYKYLWNIVLDSSVIPDDCHIFRPSKFLGCVIVSEKLKNGIEAFSRENGVGFFPVSAI